MTDASSSPALVTRLRAGEQAALARLSEVAGGGSLCAVSRSGTPQLAAKYHEGASVALAEARRAAARATSEPDALAALEHTLRTWLQRRATSVTDSADWRAYFEGGVDALEEALKPPAPGFTVPEALRPPEQVLAASRLPRSSSPGDLVRTALAPRRRRIALAVAAPVLFVLLVASGGLAGAPTGWLLLVAVVAALTAVILATFVPERGWRPDLGCGPCRIVTAGAVLLAVGLVMANPHGTAMASVAVAVGLFGVFQRLTKGMASCST